MSSSASPDSFVGLVRRSVEVLRAEHLEAYRAMAGRLRGELLRVEVDDEQIDLIFDGGEVREPNQAAPPSVWFRAPKDTLVDVLEARISLLDAVLVDRIRLIGSCAALARFHDGLLAYLQGAVRCPSFPALFESLKSQLRGSPCTPVGKS